ncbi:CDC2-related protein kinase [Cryptosporidium ubiquitum]|uniref:Cyclin-dependent kinase 2 homolog n=1 Tax=Cryptosporidium ubiquitum TaxID=857276 RepID=A0A1J4MJ28_9CRYT|nr:CDC2-related protein kinase [Cryptosporidium ubiquitum]OII73036.1 CDC2-related protein kinase [Cryptosporidium ubiquitum]
MRIGQGAFGDVWLAEDLTKKRHVALKKLISKESRDGFSKTAIREIVLLTNLKHENIVELYGVVFSRPHNDLNEHNTQGNPINGVSAHLQSNSPNRGSIWMVFEYLPYDLSGYIEGLKLEGRVIKVIDIKVIIRQLLSSLEYCHLNNTIHRDIKCANLLISGDGVVKLADFGLARVFNSRNRMLTNRVVTLWYRPPELLLGAQCYDTPVDMWSVGCILGELVLQQPLFCSETEAGVLKSIGDTLGSPPSDMLFELKKLPLWNDQDNNPLLQILGSGMGSKFRQFTSRVEEKVGQQGLDLLLQLLQYSPENRLTARQALEHPWLNSNDPNEVIPDKLDMSIFSQKKQFHSLNARKLREKLQGRLKAPSSSEVGGALNAIIGKAYNVDKIKKIIEEDIKTKNTSKSAETRGKQINETNSINTDSVFNVDERKFKRSRSRESENSLNGSRWKIRNSSERKYSKEYDKKYSSNTHYDRREKEREREDEYEKRRYEYSRDDSYSRNRDRELAYYDYRYSSSSRYNRDGPNGSRSNLSQHLTPPHSPQHHTYLSSNYSANYYRKRNSPPPRSSREHSSKYNISRSTGSNMYYDNKSKNEYRDYRR